MDHALHGPEWSNHRKYTDGVNNPVVRRLMDGLFRSVREALRDAQPASLLDAGCGAGHAMVRLGDIVRGPVAGFEIRPAAVAMCAERVPRGTFTTQDIHELSYADDAYDVVLCMEVLEHLERPDIALRELARVARRELVLTVPHEPWFWLGNLARGQHLEGWGNHPEHVQHWGRRSFARFLRQEFPSAEVHVRSAWPWLVATVALR